MVGSGSRSCDDCQPLEPHASKHPALIDRPLPAATRANPVQVRQNGIHLECEGRKEQSTVPNTAGLGFLQNLADFSVGQAFHVSV